MGVVAGGVSFPTHGRKRCTLSFFLSLSPFSPLTHVQIHEHANVTTSESDSPSPPLHHSQFRYPRHRHPLPTIPISEHFP